MVGYWGARPPLPSSHCERYPPLLSRKALTSLIMINQSLRRLNPFCGATHSSQHDLVLNLALLPCWTHYINYKYNKIQFKSSLTTFYIQVLFSATDFSFDWVLKCYFWNQVVRYSSAGVALNSNQLRTAGNDMTFETGLLSFRDSPTVGTTCVRRLPPFSSKLTRLFKGNGYHALYRRLGRHTGCLPFITNSQKFRLGCKW